MEQTPFEYVIGPQLVNKFPEICGTRKFVPSVRCTKIIGITSSLSIRYNNSPVMRISTLN